MRRMQPQLIPALAGILLTELLWMAPTALTSLERRAPTTSQQIFRPFHLARPLTKPFLPPPTPGAARSSARLIQPLVEPLPLFIPLILQGLRKRSGTASRWDPTTSPMLPA